MKHWQLAALLLGLATHSAIAAELVLAPAAASFDWKLPPGFPLPLVPNDNPMSAAKVDLGARLFREKRLSVSGTYDCESCHQPQFAFTDGRARAVGATGALTRNSAMSLANVAYNAAYTWSDPNVRTLERQMSQPLFNEHPIEMGLRGRESQVVALLSADTRYQGLFRAAFPAEAAPVSMDNIVKAIAAFERTLISGRSPFDRYVFDDDQEAVSVSAKRGMALFYSTRVGCAQCHYGLNFSGPLRYRGKPQAAPLMANTGLGRVRVPTLRNVALTAPYMHDGSIATLAAVIEHYASGADNHRLDRRMPALHLSEQEKADLIEFLESLTDREFIAAQGYQR